MSERDGRAIPQAQARKERSLLENDFTSPCPECGGAVFEWEDTNTYHECEDPDDEPETEQTTLVTDGGRATPQTRVGHCKADETDVYAGRGPGGRDMTETPVGKRGWLGNPYTLDDYDRAESIAEFREHFEDRLDEDKAFREAVRDLAGDVLGCWCQRLDDNEPACHAEVIAEHADRLGAENHCCICGTPASEMNLGRSEARGDLVCVACTMYLQEHGHYPDEEGPDRDVKTTYEVVSDGE